MWPRSSSKVGSNGGDAALGAARGVAHGARGAARGAFSFFSFFSFCRTGSTGGSSTGVNTGLGSLALLGAPFGLPLDRVGSGAGSGAAGSGAASAGASIASHTTSIYVLDYNYISQAIFLNISQYPEYSPSIS
jgi:hypothetical protein